MKKLQEVAPALDAARAAISIDSGMRLS
jgi:hypothetical protein